MAISTMFKRSTSQSAATRPARVAWHRAEAMLKQANADVVDLSKREALAIKAVDAYRSAKVRASDPNIIDVDPAATMQSLQSLAVQAQNAAAELLDIVPRRASAERERALIGSQLHELRRAVIHERMGEIADEYFAAGEKLRDLLEELSALGQLHDVQVEEIRKAGGQSERVGSPRVRDWALLWVPPHPAYSREVRSLDDRDVSRDIDSRKARLEREMFEP